MVDCARFLDNYSEFRDGLLPSDQENHFEDHLQACDSCAQYDRVVRDGVKVFRSLPQLTPAPDFQLRLMGRLYAREGARARGSGASVGVTLAICIVLGIGAWVPTLRSTDDVIQLPPIVAHAPYHDFSPVLLRQAQPMRSQLFAPQPVFYGGESLFSPRSTLTMFTTTSQHRTPVFLLQR